MSVQIHAQFRVVTPLMLGGANHAPEVRASSFAHVVRWWWRFLALGRYDGEPTVAAFWEAALWGWHAKPFGAKRVTFRVEGGEPPDAWGNVSWPAHSGVRYLTAQGFSEKVNGVNLATRSCVKARQLSITAKLAPPLPRATERFRDDHRRTAGEKAFLHQRVDAWDAEWTIAQHTFVDALALLGLLGGLGARSRRGFGSLAIERLTQDGVEKNMRVADVGKYRALVLEHLGAERFCGDPPYTALSNKTTVSVCATSRGHAHELMNEIGWAFQLYRSWGQSDRHGEHEHVLQPWPKISVAAGVAKAGWYDSSFQADHNGYYQRNPGVFPATEPDHRAVFGLPHNYVKGQQSGWTVPKGSELGRRASPLLMHFHPLDTERGTQHAAVLIAAPATFAPPGALLTERRGARASSRPLPAPPDWTLISGFADFVRRPVRGRPASPTGGVEHTLYTPVSAADGDVS